MDAAREAADTIVPVESTQQLEVSPVPGYLLDIYVKQVTLNYGIIEIMMFHYLYIF